MNHLKSISQTDNELRVGNYICLFGGRDLVNDFFTKNTNFQSSYTDIGTLYVDFEHGLDPDNIGNTKDNILGIIDWKSAKFDDTGVYVERILSRRTSYMKFLSELIDAGLIGTSSAAIPGQVTRKSNGEIVEWPLMRDSLTVTPMEPRMASANVLSAAKSLVEIFPDNKSLAMLSGLPIPDQFHPFKSIEEITDFKSAEAFLRDSCKLSRSQATAFFTRVKSLAQRDSAADEEASRILAAIARRTELIKS